MFANFWMQKKVEAVVASKTFYIAGGGWNVGKIEKGSAVDSYDTIKDTGTTQAYYVFANGDYVLYGTAYGAAEYSTNGGSSWTSISGPAAVRQVVYDGSKYYMGSSNGFRTSTDGESWSENSQIPGWHYCRGIAVSGSKIYVASDYGLHVSTNGGTSFTLRTTSDGLPSNTCYCCVLVGSTIWVGTGSGVCKSSDDGASWTVYTTSNGLFSSQCTKMAYDPDGGVIYCIDYSGSDTRVSLTKNNGTSWSYLAQLEITLWSNSVLMDVQYRDGVVYVTGNGYEHGIAYSDDQGDTWSYVDIANLPLDGDGRTSIYSIYIDQ